MDILASRKGTTQSPDTSWQNTDHFSSEVLEEFAKEYREELDWLSRNTNWKNKPIVVKGILYKNIDYFSDLLDISRLEIISALADENEPRVKFLEDCKPEEVLKKHITTVNPASYIPQENDVRVEIEGIVYPSMQVAADNLGTAIGILRSRCNSSNFPDWKILPDELQNKEPIANQRMSRAEHRLCRVRIGDRIYENSNQAARLFCVKAQTILDKIHSPRYPDYQFVVKHGSQKVEKVTEENILRHIAEQF